jgi:hypothetical protein
MTSSNDFNDMMPHTLSVASGSVSGTRAGDYGGYTPGSSRTYHCLKNQGETIETSSGGVEFRKGLVAYVNPIPVGGSTPQDILETDQVTIDGVLTPVDAIERHWDETGTLYALVVRFE